MTPMTLTATTPAPHRALAGVVARMQGTRLYILLAAVTVLPLLGNVVWLVSGQGAGGIDPTPYSVAVGLVGLTWLICANHSMDLRADHRAVTARAAALETALIEAEAQMARMADRCTDLERQLNTDPLTGALNRRGLETAFDAHGTGTVMALLDIDHFKKINDTYGHAVGDRVLKDFTRLLRARLNDALPVYRVGGEEFVVFFPETQMNTVVALFDQVRRDLHRDAFSRTTDRVPVSFSAGLALRDRDTLGFSDMFKLADDRLYTAKTAGRARTVCDDATPQEPLARAG